MSCLITFFDGNAWQLPEGLELVDDLDSAIGGWKH
jgi:hypothetical protein